MCCYYEGLFNCLELLILMDPEWNSARTGLLFRKENVTEVKNHISPNQTNILDQINEVGDLEHDEY